MRKIMFAVGMLLLLPLSAAFAEVGGRGNAMSPVGVWDFEVVNTFGDVDKSLVVFNFGGTATTTPSTNVLASLFGTWEKTKGRTFVVSFYSFIVDEGTDEHIGYVKAIVENTLVDKDTIEGRTEVWILFGTDPFNPLDMFLGFTTEDVGRRLPTEGPS
jgi:hypothetical protein